MNNNNLIDWLTYKSYEHNRARNPHIPAYKWRQLFKDAVQFEEIFEVNFNRIKGVLSHDTINS